MAYTAVVTKQGVIKTDDNIYKATIQIVVNDGFSDVFTETASAKYNNNSPDMTAIQIALIDQLKAKWDKYVAENGIYVAAEFDTMISAIQTAANTYINA